MRINLLGRFELQDDRGRAVPQPGPKRRALLAALALDLGRTVPAERLTGLLWGSSPPAAARSALQGHVTAVRRLLAAAAEGASPAGSIPEDPDGLHLVGRGSGYALLGHPDAVDAHRFERLCAAAYGEAATDAAGLLHTALALWRGPALDRCGSARLAAEAGPRLTVARWRAVERLAVETLARRDDPDGRMPEVVAQLRALLAAEPRRRTTAALLARCLERPGPSRESGAEGELARESFSFIGRAGELARLDAAVATADGRPLLLTGPAGVGKTRLAHAWADRRADRFPDGRHTVDLHGDGLHGDGLHGDGLHGDDTAPLTPSAALAALLRALGAAELPGGDAERAALLRALTAGRRMLLLLDDAGSAEQVEALLPGHPGVLVLVTGRARLTAELVARQGAVPLPLGALAPAEAVGLLAATAGAGRIAREPEAAARLVGLCDQLPLAVGLVGARIAAGGGGVAAVVAELAEERGKGSDGVAAALRVGRRTLRGEAARVLALTGLLPGAGIDERDVAALGEVPASRARDLLAGLAAARFAESDGPGRYGRPGPVRRYAAELAAALPAVERAAALGRLLGCWADSAEAASVAEGPDSTYDTADQGDAVAWFRRARPALAALARAGAAHGLDAEVWRLAHGCGPLHYQDGAHLDEWEELAREGLAAAERLGDRAARLRLRTDLGLALVSRKRFTEAAAVAGQAVADAAETADTAVRDRCLTALAGTLAASGRGYEAIAVLERVVASCEAGGDGPSTARALDHLAHCLHRVGEAERGLAYTDRALDLLRDHPGDPLHGTLRFSRAEALRVLGRVEEALGASCEALAFAEKHHDTRLTLLALDFNGALLAELGRRDEAADHWRRALALHTAEGHPNPALARRLVALDE
ncbi:BTAD domain-containing putative transcriptional regulator [Kitasatospora sp. NPDC008115]|uniref:BTAD domain-containing putative transcriptional regulator n=1 Tax=Kitasatospora sp. NPDC008115 TaxID=3364022 RepID=UPI0036E5381A